MKKLLIAVAPLALITACSGGGADSLEAGEWTMTSNITDVELTGLPDEMQEMMGGMTEQMMGEQDPSTRCITEEEAAEPGASLFAPEDAGDDCDFGDSTVEGGVITINGTCQGPGGQGNAEMEIAGTYTATTMEAEMNVTVADLPNPMGGDESMGMTMTGTMSAERTGDCEAEG